MESAERKALEGRWRAVLGRLERAAAACGRSAGEVALVAVSKLHPAEDVAELALLGQRDFGENYVQEALEKRKELEGLLPPELFASLRWHMIGHVQSRKAALVAGAFGLVHSVDSKKLASALDGRVPQGSVQPVLIEVNVGAEAQKSGAGAGSVLELAEHLVAACPRLSLQGLMCIPPVFDAGEGARPYFAELRGLRDELSERLGLPLPTLSMGMSGDFEWAVAEGATLVRVGTDIFGPRPPRRA